MLKGFAISIPLLAIALFYLSEGIYWDGLHKIGLDAWLAPVRRFASEYWLFYLGVLIWIYFVLLMLFRVVWLRLTCRVILTAILLFPLLVLLHYSREAYHSFLWGSNHWVLWLLVGMLTYWVWKLAGHSLLLPDRRYWRRRSSTRSSRAGRASPGTGRTGSPKAGRT